MKKKGFTRREFLERTSSVAVAAGIRGVTIYSLPGLAEDLQESIAGITSTSELFDIAPFARRCIADRNTLQVPFEYVTGNSKSAAIEKLPDGRCIYGLQWAEERDINEVRVSFDPWSTPTISTVEYWFDGWPYPPPEMPSIEDPADDPWQGKWLPAMTKIERLGSEHRYRFLPLEVDENPAADNLAKIDYRRSLKMRLVFPVWPNLSKVAVFTGSKQKVVSLRLELGAGETTAYEWQGKIHVYNGVLKHVKPWQATTGDLADEQHFHVTSKGARKGLMVDVVAAEPLLAGSNDLTVVTLEAGERTFSFAVSDVEKGPVYVPDFHAYVTLASDAAVFDASIVKRGEKIREKLAKEPEQTLERAEREIPELDPAERQWPTRLQLPLAIDSSWQKFAFEWGGNVMISKLFTKAKGHELKRLDWHEDQIYWLIGTGFAPTFRPGWQDSELHILDDCLPIVTAKWSTDRIDYIEEAFATSLYGPLSPEDPQRNEQTPAVLALRVTAHNTTDHTAISHFWLATRPDEEMAFKNGEFVNAVRPLVRARLHLPDAARASLESVPYNSESLHGLHTELTLAPGQESSILIFIPFIPRLSDEERTCLAALEYESERARVLKYWQEVVNLPIPFEVPEARLMSLGKANLVHIRISVTKDPRSGLYMLPPAAYLYDAYAEEIGIQAVGLDALGDHRHATLYLESMLQLQGSRPFAGTYTGTQTGVYHGARIDEEYDYTAEGDYNIDHGLVLWGLAEHYFYTRDREWLAHAASSMKRAADWVIEQRKLTQVLDGDQRALEYGLLPAGRLEDSTDWASWFSINAFALFGMLRMAAALADANMPQADYYREQSDTYRQDIRAAVLRAARLAPVTRLRDNTYIPWVPAKPHQRFRLWGPQRVGLYSRYSQRVLPCFRSSATREVLYAPIILLVCGAFDDKEQLADWVLDDWEDNLTMSTALGLNVHGWVDDEYWFSRGGMVFEANLHNPILPYLRRNEIPAAIRNFFNDFAACRYRDVNAFTEEYHEWVHGSGPFYKGSEELRSMYWLRNMLLLEQDDTLLLGPGIPRRWLMPGEKIEVRNAPSYFGPVSYNLKCNDSGIDARIKLPTRNAYKQATLVVRAPEEKKISSVTIDGRAWNDFDPGNERIRLPLTAQEIDVVVRL